MTRWWYFWRWGGHTGITNLLGEVLRTRAKYVGPNRRVISAMGHKATPTITGRRARLVQ